MRIARFFRLLLLCSRITKYINENEKTYNPYPTAGYRSRKCLAFPTETANITPKDTTKVIDIEEIVIIATPKENNRLRQQPISATSLSQHEMQSNAVTSVKSLSSLVPNLFIPDYGSKLTTSVYVRGIGSRINTPAVGLYVDNIPFIDKSAFDFNYSDIERIDVMRGPQGTLYGRNTMGGLIRVFTKSPFTYQGTDLRLGAATYNDYKASLTHYHRVSEKFAFSTGFFYEHEADFSKILPATMNVSTKAMNSEEESVPSICPMKSETGLHAELRIYQPGRLSLRIYRRSERRRRPGRTHRFGFLQQCQRIQA